MCEYRTGSHSIPTPGTSPRSNGCSKRAGTRSSSPTRYKLHAGDSNDEREAVDLMRRFDEWRERFGFALLLPVHCRNPVPGIRFSIHDLFGSSAYVRGAEVVLGVQRVRDGYAKLHFLKDRDGDLPINTSWGMLFDREQGFRRDPNDGRKETCRDKVEETARRGPRVER